MELVKPGLEVVDLSVKIWELLKPSVEPKTVTEFKYEQDSIEYKASYYGHIYCFSHRDTLVKSSLDELEQKSYEMFADGIKKNVLDRYTVLAQQAPVMAIPLTITGPSCRVFYAWYVFLKEEPNGIITKPFFDANQIVPTVDEEWMKFTGYHE